MLIRRCAALFLEPREHLDLDLATLFAGEQALTPRVEWVALAPHLGGEATVSAGEVAALSSIGESLWIERSPADARFGRGTIEALLARGLLLSNTAKHARWRELDERVRQTRWWPLSAALHATSRWRGQQASPDPMAGYRDFAELVAEIGPPPAEVTGRGPGEARLPLPAPAPAPLDGPLRARYTGRNYDPRASLPLSTASRLLQRTFGAQARREVAPGMAVLKKGSPSAGGLHPIAAYVLAQRIEGVPVGLYHYHPVAHALEPVRALAAAEAAELASRFVARQSWFAGAPWHVVLVCRFARNFWKYRNHPKAYRAVILDAGHLSQTFFLLAAEAGLPAFITAAINEVDIAEALDLDGVTEDALAVCGCGPAAAEATVVELRSDPA
ncbi:MAG TPA: putative peptide maturation dehydrogenase [Myxococcaceae bacterium]|jgi:putative peptide maturation dehydrogenase